MASVDTMARSQQELLEAGRAKLAKYKERHNKNKTKNSRNTKAVVSPDGKIYANGNPNVEISPAKTHSDVVKTSEHDVDRNGVQVDLPRRIQFEPVDRKNERLVEEKRGSFVAADDDENKRKLREAEELRRKVRNAEEAMRKERELEEQRNQLALVRLKTEREAEERRQKQREAEEARRKEREGAEEARRKALEEEDRRKEREADLRRGPSVAADDEDNKRKLREAEELRRRMREAEEAIRKERELEEQRNQLALVRLKIEREAEERRQKQREAEEARRKERDDAEEARRKALEEEVKRKEEEAKRKEREADDLKRRQHYISEVAKRKEREAEEIRRKEREAEEIRKKEREAEDLKRRQRVEEEFRRKQREEFSGLEQHIQDLTEEKFALQRELGKARAITEDFVSEQTALVENFNNQGQVVNRLNEVIEELEGRIKEREAFAMALMVERDRAYQDFAAAREQSQTMAGEVIVLENRIRTLRSHELKLEKDMGILNAEVESHRRQAGAWEKDRSHLQTLIDALQEEKKVLQVRLRKVASGEREFSYRSETPEAVQLKQRVFTDVSTSTDDLPPSPLKISSEGPSTPLDSPSLDTWHHGRRSEEPHSSQSAAEPSHFRSTHEASMRPPSSSDTHSQLPFSYLACTTGSPQSGLGYQSTPLPVSATSIPADLMRTINNINDVVASLGEEKTAMVKALKAESKGAAELRALNADLSRKLAATTQQLELVVSQRMAEGSSTSRLTTSRKASAALDYVDEGDEVVDRVFTWIMQLFPSRDSRRNGVKRL